MFRFAKKSLVQLELVNSNQLTAGIYALRLRKNFVQQRFMRMTINNGDSHIELAPIFNTLLPLVTKFHNTRLRDKVLIIKVPIKYLMCKSCRLGTEYYYLRPKDNLISLALRPP